MRVAHTLLPCRFSLSCAARSLNTRRVSFVYDCVLTVTLKTPYSKGTRLFQRYG